MPKQKDSLYFGMSTSDNPITQAMRNNPFAKLQKKMAANPHFPSAGAKPKKQSSTGERSDSSLSKKPFANYIDSLQNSGKPITRIATRSVGESRVRRILFRTKVRLKPQETIG